MHNDVFDRIRKQPGMYLQETTYAAAAAFVLGYDLACEGGALVGFREWLVLRLGKGSNLAWFALVPHYAFPESSSPQDAVTANSDAQRHAIDTLFDLIAEFQRERCEPDGLRTILTAYTAWLERRSG